MALTTNEIRKRLNAFAKEQKGASNERSQAQTFWLRFYECFGIRDVSAAIYEQSVKKIGGAQGFIDSFIPGKLIVEHKSRGKDLDAAFTQASDYFLSLKEEERPRYIITSDFARIRLYDLQAGGGYRQCKLSELAKKADWFLFLVEGEITDFTEESEADRSAAYAISKLHESLLRANFKGRKLEVLLTRLLFCLFAEDTGIFGENGQFRRLVEGTRPDGKDLGGAIAELFQVLNTPEEDRQKNLDEALMRFAYINGKLFSEKSDIPSFDSELRDQLLACARLDWSGISPAIFGAMFQGVLEEHNPDGADSSNRKASRRELGAHYTSERNILRVINPLCMDDLRAELSKVKRNKKLLQAFYDKLPTLTFFDPACGCGNFLVIAFRELRQLEMDTIEAMSDVGLTKGGLLDVSTLCRVKVNQFYGIEIDEAAAHIGRVALWITDHQMNLEAADRFGTTRPTVPLVDSATIFCENSLRIDWNEVIPAERCSYVLGNPPFIGKQYQTEDQKHDMELIFGKVKGAGVLDYVSCWHATAARYIQSHPSVKVAFVSTNSITQGEQVSILWQHLLSQGVKIHFCHRTFQWSNEGKGVAAVHCVIIGFGLEDSTHPIIFDYSDNVKGEPFKIAAKRINPYLVDGPVTVLEKRRNSICAAPEMGNGSMPNDGGNFLMNDSEKEELLRVEPLAERWIRPFLMGDEFINNISRWCLWLQGITPSELRSLPYIKKRVEAVKELRLASTRPTTQELANTPTLFGEIRQPRSPKYLAVPKVSSERRKFIPIGFLNSEVICGDKIFFVADAKVYTFGILNSTMHNAWMRAVCGRLESRYSYSNTIVYNNYPWPSSPNEKAIGAVEVAAQSILDARDLYPESSLADLYDPTAMPPELVKAHAALDKAVDAAYGYKGGKEDAARVAYLFERYQELTSLLPVSKAKKTKKA